MTGEHRFLRTECTAIASIHVLILCESREKSNTAMSLVSVRWKYLGSREMLVSDY